TYLMQSLAFQGYNKEYAKTFGGKVWWRDVQASGGYKIQQNIISNHFRILDNADRRVCSSFEFTYMEHRLKELSEVAK
ncbi:MAG: transcriptional regulator, partial [Hyphomonadaceae bacterium]|nr:transcriptional regulator [Clostridia bacterium]